MASLDLLRGVASIAVVSFHIQRGIGDLLPGSYLAVDFFFMLSGLVMATAYGQELSDGLGFWSFVRIRLARLYPMYAFGTALSAGTLVLWCISSGWPIPWQGIAIALGFAALFVPAIRGMSLDHNNLFPLNGPSWSLWCELVVNFGYALIARNLTTGLLAAIVLIGFGLDTRLELVHGSLQVGWEASDPLSGLYRVVFPFFMGLALARLKGHRPLSRARMSPFTACVVLVLTFSQCSSGQAFWDLAVVTVVYPVLIVASINDGNGPLDRMFCWFGEISYPLYATHWAYISHVRRWLDASLGSGGMLELAAEFLFLSVAVVVAWLTAVLVDRPIRRWLARRRDLRGHGDAVAVP